jgi:hypothetical protein
MKKRGWLLLLVLSLNALPALSGCHVDADDDDKVEIKADTKGAHKGVTIDKD